MIREVRLEDLGEIKEIFADWMVDAKTGKKDPEEVERYLGRVKESIEEREGRRKYDSCYLVLESKGGEVMGIVGYRMAHPKMLRFMTKERPTELNLLFVAKKHRGGEGVGTALMKAVEEVARKKGYEEILVRSAEKYQETGWGFYDRQDGYKRVGMIKEDPGKPQIWSKEL